jgi:hypothetical protein
MLLFYFTWLSLFCVARVLVDVGRPPVSGLLGLFVAFHAGGGPFGSADFQTFFFRREVVLVALAAVEGEGLAAVRLRVEVPSREHAAA